MEILGSIQGENVAIEGREKMQRQMRDFISRLQKGDRWNSGNVLYKVHFWRPFFGAKVDSLIEFRADGQEAWFARANGPDPWKAFCRAMGSLKQIVTEMEMREEGAGVNESGET
ncbi:MAG TPA: hypothetical protein VIH99_12955 [Bdellovibrionota bacterium]|jgi:hypothetical protein